LVLNRLYFLRSSFSPLWKIVICYASCCNQHIRSLDQGEGGEEALQGEETVVQTLPEPEAGGEFHVCNAKRRGKRLTGNEEKEQKGNFNWGVILIIIIFCLQKWFIIYFSSTFSLRPFEGTVSFNLGNRQHERFLPNIRLQALLIEEWTLGGRREGRGGRAGLHDGRRVLRPHAGAEQRRNHRRQD